jgi:hypothetical protein
VAKGGEKSKGEPECAAENGFVSSEEDLHPEKTVWYQPQNALGNPQLRFSA